MTQTCAVVLLILIEILLAGCRSRRAVIAPEFLVADSGVRDASAGDVPRAPDVHEPVRASLALPIKWAQARVRPLPSLMDGPAPRGVNVAVAVRVALEDPTRIVAVYPRSIARSLDDGVTWERFAMPVTARSESVSIDAHGDVYWLTHNGLDVRRVGASQSERLQVCLSGAGRALGVGFGAIYTLCATELAENMELTRNDEPPRVPLPPVRWMRKSLDGGRTWTELAVPTDAEYSTGLFVDRDGNLQQTFDQENVHGDGHFGRWMLRVGETSWFRLDVDASNNAVTVGRDGWGYRRESVSDGDLVAHDLYAQLQSARQSLGRVAGEYELTGSFNGRETLLLLGSRMLVMDGVSLLRVLEVGRGVTLGALDSRMRIVSPTAWGLLRYSEDTGWVILDRPMGVERPYSMRESMRGLGH
ncbi:MAG: hypothetical protein Q8Q09_00180 [Deltaproteobacteria bacterium]|nr:hypothetical protein [Deltaproteobacteria bacterium]